jgi:hypothetical protein
MAKRSSRSRGPMAAGIAPFGGQEIQPAWIVSDIDRGAAHERRLGSAADTIERQLQNWFFLVSVGAGSVVAKV